MRVSGSVTGGTVFGMSSTQVTPPHIADKDPVEKVSFWVMPGSRKCTCGSTNPGRTVMLEPNSILSSPPETRFPTVTIFPSEIPTSVYFRLPPRYIRPQSTVSGSIILS
jgi:hypothetical protein